MKLRLIIPIALTAVALAGCGNSASTDSAGAETSESASASPTTDASASTSEPEPAAEATAGSDAGEPESTEAAATPLPTTAQGEQPKGPGVASFSECSDEYLGLTTDLLPGGGVSPELLEQWQTAYDDASQYYAEGSPDDAARICSEVLADVKATVGG